MSAPIGPEEVWRDIADTDGDYQVSSLGRVRRTREMRWGQLPAWGLVRCRPNNHGYLMFNTAHRGKSLNVALHLVVLRTFRGDRPGNFHGAHLNGNRQDARLTNLAWVSAAANEAHKVAHGTAQRGERAPMAKLTWADVREIRASSENNREIAERFGLNRNHVSDIRRGACWVDGPSPRRRLHKLEIADV
jgi:hypothetical protein